MLCPSKVATQIGNHHYHIFIHNWIILLQSYLLFSVPLKLPTQPLPRQQQPMLEQQQLQHRQQQQPQKQNNLDVLAQTLKLSDLDFFEPAEPVRESSAVLHPETQVLLSQYTISYVIDTTTRVNIPVESVPLG